MDFTFMLRIKSLEEYHQLCQRGVDSPELFWNEIAESFHWYQRWNKTLEWDFHSGHTKWYIGGKTNITYNCLDRHIQNLGDQPALIWEPNDPSDPNRIYTYSQLLDEVNKTAHGLVALGVEKGDRVCVYMPMVPELVFTLLACARIGAVHSVVFAGFSAISLAERINDAQCKWVITADANARGDKLIPVKDVVDEALAMGCESVEKVIVYNNYNTMISWNPARDVWWHDIITRKNEFYPAVEMDSEDLLFILYTSGSTGKPKGVVHTCGGYMVYTAYSFQNVFQYQAGKVFWCTADAGWITGHSYLVYGPLLSGATTLMFEGIPAHPDASRCWQIVEKHKVNIFYTAPTAIRSLMAHGDHFVEGPDTSSLRVLGSVGEPINEEAWHWYHDKIGRGKIPIVDTWWQTETGGIMISSLAGITDHKPAYASYPLPGVQPVLLTSEGDVISENEKEGLLCIRFPWPSILRTTYGDHERCRLNYFSQYPGLYFTGDSAKRDANGRYRIIGRVDDVINVSGHRLGTAEIENAINEHPAIVESAVVGYPHKIKGQGIFAFVIVVTPVNDEDQFFADINHHLAHQIGPIAKADKVMIVSGLPKTRSGKIMRRILRKVAEGDTAGIGDLSTLLNPEIVQEITNKYHETISK